LYAAPTNSNTLAVPEIAQDIFKALPQKSTITMKQKCMTYAIHVPLQSIEKRGKKKTYFLALELLG
jgi:hypothetical protein